MAVNDREQQIADARRAADAIRGFAPAEAARIDAAIAELEHGGRDSLKVNVGIHFRLEKFDGEYEPGKQPVEVIEGHDNL